MLDFWFEFASPYSYIAAMRIESLCAERDVTLRWRPFLLGPIFQLQGWNTSHYNLNPLRGNYMWRDMERLTQKFHLPYRRPSVFPKNCVLAARVAAAYEDEPWIGAYVKEAFVANFGDDRDLNAAAPVIELLSQFVANSEACFDRAVGDPLRSRLRENTDRAIAMGLFGAPNCVVGDELFWGEEALDDAVEWARSGRVTSLR